MRGREKDSKREGVCVYMELIHLIIQQKHNTVNQLYSNLKSNKKIHRRLRSSQKPLALVALEQKQQRVQRERTLSFVICVICFKEIK